MQHKVIVVSPNGKLASSVSQSLQDEKRVAGTVSLHEFRLTPALGSLLSASDPAPLLLVDLSMQEPALRFIERVRASHPGVPIVATDGSKSGDLILRAIRAGASEFFLPPFEVERLHKLFVRLNNGRLAKLRTTTPKGRLIAFMQARGGDGATTVALHVAAGLFQAGKRRVLVMDLDLHSGTLDFRLRLKPASTLADALERVDEIDELWSRIKTPWKTFDVLPSPPSARALPAKGIQLLPALLDYVARIYPVVILDMPPAFFSSHPEIADSLDIVYVVATPHLTSLHLARRRIRELESSYLQHPRVGVVLNRFGSNRKILSSKQIAEALGMPISAQIDNDFEAVRSAAFEADLVPARSRLGRQFGQLANQIVGLSNRERPPTSRSARLVPVAG